MTPRDLMPNSEQRKKERKSKEHGWSGAGNTGRARCSPEQQAPVRDTQFQLTGGPRTLHSSRGAPGPCTVLPKQPFSPTTDFPTCPVCFHSLVLLYLPTTRNTLASCLKCSSLLLVCLVNPISSVKMSHPIHSIYKHSCSF